MSDAKPPDWDARTYHRVSNPQFTWGLKVLERLPLRGDETVIDAGCGSGRLTEKLLERLPRGRVIALDFSAAMLAEARAHLSPRFGDQVEYVQADLGALGLSQVADVVFSTATFHWVKDHDRLFDGLYKALRPGGRLCAQCGGGRNLERIHARAHRLGAQAPYAPFFQGYEEPTNFQGEAATRERLERSGFRDAKVWLEEAPARFPDAESCAEFLRTVVLRPHLARLPDETLKAGFLRTLVSESAEDDPPFTLDYWRLNMDAARSA